MQIRVVKDRQRYHTVEYVKNKVDWIERQYTPDLVLHLTFAKPTGKLAAHRALHKFLHRMARNKLWKQHITAFIYGGRQELRGYAYHFHVAISHHKKRSIMAFESMKSVLKELWKLCGGGKAQIEPYRMGGGVLHYAMLYHPDETIYTACNARRPCRKTGCRWEANNRR